MQKQVKSHLVDRYTKLHNNLDLVGTGYSTVHQIMAARLALFKDYETILGEPFYVNQLRLMKFIIVFKGNPHLLACLAFLLD